MTSAVQVQYRRGTSSQVSAFTGATGEMVVDTTNNRVVVQDGATTGGFPAAKLSEVQTNARTQVSDGNYTALTTDRLVAYITLTASRIVSLPAASTYPSGSRLLVVDESGNCSASKTITLSANGSDLIDGASSAVISTAYGYVALECNTANKWTIVDQVGSTLNGLQGALTLAATDGAVVSASGTTVSIGGPGGMVNKFRNGTMDVWQRGTSGTSTTTAGVAQTAADGWYVIPAGASVTWAQASGRLLTKNSLQVTGATSVTDVQVQQRIESLIAAAFCSQTVTVQAQVYNGTGGSITPTLTVKHAGSQDVWTSPTTDVNAVSLEACAASAWTLVSYTFSANAASYNGLEVIFDFGNNFGANTKSIQITECDIRVTPGATSGQTNSNPPPPELRPVAIELAFCQRYFSTNEFGAANDSTMSTFPGFASASNTIHVANIVLPVSMRAGPTVTLFSPNQGTPSNGMFSYYNGSAWTAASATSAVFVSQFTFSVSLTVSGVTFGEAYITGGVWAASAEL
jgi:hypothetical protein